MASTSNEKFRDRLYQNTLFRFGIVGISNTLFDFFYFAIFITAFGIQPLLSNIISYIVVVTQSYVFNKYWAFKKAGVKKASVAEYLLFFTASLGSLIVSSLIIYFGEAFANIWVLKISASVIGPLVNYLSYKFLVFAPQRTSD